MEENTDSKQTESTKKRQLPWRIIAATLVVIAVVVGVLAVINLVSSDEVEPNLVGEQNAQQEYFNQETELYNRLLAETSSEAEKVSIELNQANAAYRFGDFEQAIGLLEKAIDSNELSDLDLLNTQLSLADAYAQLGDFENALKIAQATVIPAGIESEELFKSDLAAQVDAYGRGELPVFGIEDACDPSIEEIDTCTDTP